MEEDKMMETGWSSSEESEHHSFLEQKSKSEVDGQKMTSSSPRANSVREYPVDSKYSWFVAALSCLIYSVTLGVIRSLGIILVEMREYYDISESMGMWILSTTSCMILIAGPISSLLLTKLPIRGVMILGYCLLCASLIATIYVPSYHYLFICFFLMGVAMNFMFFTCIVAVTMYFEKQRATAIGLASAGAGIGTFYMPPLIRVMFDRLSYQQCIFLLCGIVIHMCVPAMLVRPLSYWERKKKPQPNVSLILTADTPNSLTVDAPNLLSASVSSVMTSIVHIYEVDIENTSKPPNKKSALPAHGTEATTFRSTLRLLFTNQMFLVFLVSNYLMSCGCHIIFTIIPQWGQELHVGKNHIALAISIGGGLEIVARFGNGFFANRRYVSAMTQLGVAVILAGTSTLILVSWRDQGAFYLCGALNGLSLAPVVTLIPIVLLERFDKAVVSLALGIVYGVQGGGVITSYGVTASLQSWSGSWSLGLYFMAASMLSGGLIHILYSLLNPNSTQKYLACRRKTEETVTEDKIYSESS